MIAPTLLVGLGGTGSKIVTADTDQRYQKYSGWKADSEEG